ncbi:MAG: (2Fe-2S)-binding protein [Clostridiales Family XIII bacterium]|jgi:aerobic-type carbon monoxide dehydrogenase small subunit (CoxS/CutS family)|nr:(2Fe-2S)-binding protein [Clostridiales Family XIII bacterium]
MEHNEINLIVNGQRYRLWEGRDYEPYDRLSDLLRERLGFTGVRVSCGEGACGACTVLLNGKSTLSCLMPAVQADGQHITTIEALTGDDPVARAFAEECDPGYGTAMQCGFCTPAYVLETKSLLAEYPNPTREQIREGLSGHICRCGCYKGIAHAVEKAARLSAREGGQAT